MYEYAHFEVTDVLVIFSYSDDGPDGTQPHNGDPNGAIGDILAAFPCEDIEVHNESSLDVDTE